MGELRIEITKRVEPLSRGFLAVEQGVHFGDPFGDPALFQVEENGFFAIEIGVESAAGVSGLGGDVFEAGGFEADASEHQFGGGEEFAASGFGARALAGGGSFPRGRLEPDVRRLPSVPS